MMLGARTGAWAKIGGVVQTARDYVQDGLIGLWDGIENAGWGTHSSSATVWKDLVGTVDAIINGEWASDSIQRTTNFYNKGAAEIMGRWNAYFEVVFRFSGKAEDISFSVVKLGRYGSIYAPNDTMRLNESTQTNDFDLVLELNKTYSISDMDGTIYSNSEKINQTTNPRSWYSGENDAQRFLFCTPGSIFCIRRYSRALSADEIAANYAIDKARFNLP